MSVFPQNIVCETSIVADGNMSFVGESQERVREHRRTFLTRIGVESVDYLPIRCNHGERIAHIRETDRNTRNLSEGIDAEAVITKERDLPLLLLTADCIPLSLYDKTSGTIALAHISRVTLEQGLVGKVLAHMRSSCTIDLTSTYAYLGPHIHKHSYRFALPLTYIHETLTPFIEVYDGYAYIDLTQACIQALIQSGIDKAHIGVSPIDTSLSDKHFSYYRSKHSGEQTTNRIATVLMLR
jgi:copper oxidase (laccase) domain-containing protein